MNFILKIIPNLKIVKLLTIIDAPTVIIVRIHKTNKLTTKT